MNRIQQFIYDEVRQEGNPYEEEVVHEALDSGFEPEEVADAIESLIKSGTLIRQGSGESTRLSTSKKNFPRNPIEALRKLGEESGY